MKTAAEPHVKRELNHLQARLGQAGTQLQNASATALRPEASGGLAASSRVDREGRDRVCHRGAV